MEVDEDFPIAEGDSSSSSKVTIVVKNAKIMLCEPWGGDHTGHNQYLALKVDSSAAHALALQHQSLSFFNAAISTSIGVKIIQH